MVKFLAQYSNILNHKSLRFGPSEYHHLLKFTDSTYSMSQPHVKPPNIESGKMLLEFNKTNSVVFL